MFRRCSGCGRELLAQAVDHDDAANGLTSHGYCGPCERDWRAREGLDDGFLAYLRGLGLMPLLVILIVPAALLGALGARAVALG